MEENHPLLAIDVEEHARNSVRSQVAPNLVQTRSHRTTGRHSDRPSEFDGLDVLRDATPVLPFERSKPFPHRFIAGLGPIEDGGYALHLIALDFREGLYHNRYTRIKVLRTSLGLDATGPCLI